MMSAIVIPSLPESVRDHVRDNLHHFVSDLENFASETERDEAQNQYKMLLNAERDLKGLVKQFKRLPNTPDDKLFNMEMFKRTVDDTILSRAILNQLNRNPVALKAAWDYFAITQSERTLQVLQGKASGPRRPKFRPESEAMNKNVLQVNQQKAKEEKINTSGPKIGLLGGATQTPKKISTAQTSTSICVFCENKGIFFCYDCNSAFCKPCRENHDKLPPSKKHSVIDLKSVNPSAVKLRCELHKSEYTFYCIPCNTLVCNICVTSDHKGHDMSEIKAKSDEIKRRAHTKLSDMKDNLQRISKLAAKTKMVHIPNLDEDSEDAIARIRRVGNDLQKLIETKTDIKVNEVEDMTQWKKEELQSAWKNKERIHRKQTAVYESLETLLSEEHAVSFLVSYQTLKRDMCDLTSETKDDIEPHHIQTPDLKGFLDDTIHSLQEYRKKLE